MSAGRSVSTSTRAARPARATATTGWFDDALLAVVVLLLTVPVLQPLMAQQASRYTLTAALWDDRTIVLDDYADSISVDFARRDGALLSDKAPGQPVLALPAYAVYRALGGEPGVLYRPWGNLGLWATSVWSSAIPAAILAVLLRRRGLGSGWSPPTATAAALALTTGTMLLPFATQLFSHVLTATLLYGALVVLRSRPRSAVGLFGAGTLAALAVTTEYSAALAGVVLFGAAVWQSRLRAVWFLAGGVVPAALLAVYHTVAFGGPLVTGYEFSGAYAQFHEVGFFGITPPDPGMLADVLLGDRGLLLLTPLVLAGVVGCVALVADRQAAPRSGGAGRVRSDAAIGLILTGLYVLMMAGWSSATAGASPGPRYVVAALPFLLPGVAHAFTHWPVPTWAAAAVGWFTMALATYTMPLAPRAEPWALSYWWDRLVAGDTADTLLGRYVVGGADWLPVLAAVVVAALLLARQRSVTVA